ncbi:MAG TPA: uroporphyrinogen decarboxylase family protein [Spirochaetia bacterium]|nr:uroporphyrinogen decarboxylase family protein [Spirochaetia bacterium]
MELPHMRPFLYDFFKENNRCLYGPGYELAFDEPGIERIDALPVRPLASDERPHVPVLIELGEDWIIEKTKSDYRRYILDYDYQLAVREHCARLLGEEIGFYLKPKVDTSSLLHGSVYGNPIEYPEGSTPWLTHIIKDRDDIRKLIDRMEKTDLAQAGLVPEFVRRYRRLGKPYAHRILHDPTSVHGPGTILGFLCGIDEFSLFLYDEPDLMQELLALISGVTVAYSQTVRRRTGAPMNGVGIFDDVAGLVSPEQFSRYFLPVYERIYASLAPHPEDDRFIHNDACVRHLLPFFRELGVNGINPDPDTPAEEIRAYLPDAIIYGCVPPLVLKDGTPDAVVAAARKTLEALPDDRLLVLTTAGSINMGTPYENLEALCYAAQTYGRYR